MTTVFVVIVFEQAGTAGVSVKIDKITPDINRAYDRLESLRLDGTPSLVIGDIVIDTGE